MESAKRNLWWNFELIFLSKSLKIGDRTVCLPAQLGTPKNFQNFQIPFGVNLDKEDNQ
jgi:hypothetical protein